MTPRFPDTIRLDNVRPADPEQYGIASSESPRLSAEEVWISPPSSEPVPAASTPGQSDPSTSSPRNPRRQRAGVKHPGTNATEEAIQEYNKKLLEMRSLEGSRFIADSQFKFYRWLNTRLPKLLTAVDLVIEGPADKVDPARANLLMRLVDLAAGTKGKPTKSRGQGNQGVTIQIANISGRGDPSAPQEGLPPASPLVALPGPDREVNEDE